MARTRSQQLGSSLSVAAFALLAGGLASAALLAPSGLAAHKNYESTPGSNGYVSFDTLSATTIAAGTSSVGPVTATGSSYANSNIEVPCPKVPKNGPFDTGISVGLPAITLTPTAGRYGFSKTFTVADLNTGGTPEYLSATVTITGTVVSASSVSGTLKVEAAACTSPVSRPYTATANSDPIPPADR